MGFKGSFKQIFARGDVGPVTELLIRQMDLAINAVEVANQACSKDQDPSQLNASIKEIREETKEVRDEVVSEMASALTVPLEREDLHRATQALTMITYDARDLVRELTIWEVTTGKWSKDSLLHAVRGLEELIAGLEKTDYEEVAGHFLRAYKRANRIRRTYQGAMTILFSEELTMDTLKKREILKRVEMIGRHLAELSSLLLEGLAKRYL